LINKSLQFSLFLLFISALTTTQPPTLFSQASPSANRIESVRCELINDVVTIRIIASTTIESFQKPELSGSEILVRLPDMGIENDAVHESCALHSIAVSSKLIRNILVLRIEAGVANSEVEITRDGSNALVLSVSRGAKVRASGANGRKWMLDVIVIDAGHGGVDGGAEGVNGVFEKDVTLQLALQLRDKLRTLMPDTKVVMTRETDVFVELFRRTQIANEAGGKLFVSIHCNSMPTKPHPANGCETYILRPGRNADAARVASRENSSVQFEKPNKRYGAMDEEQIIVATMAQRSFVRFSELFASNLQKTVAQNSPLQNRGVNQAGFYVLVGASMPNVLFETAFLSNEKDASFISSSSGQTKMVNAMSNAIVQYAEKYQETLNK